MTSTVVDDVSPAVFSYRFAVTIPRPRLDRRDRQRRLAEKLRAWSQDPSDYDERVGGLVSDLLESEPVRFPRSTE